MDFDETETCVASKTGHTLWMFSTCQHQDFSQPIFQHFKPIQDFLKSLRSAVETCRVLGGMSSSSFSYLYSRLLQLQKIYMSVCSQHVNRIFLFSDKFQHFIITFHSIQTKAETRSSLNISNWVQISSKSFTPTVETCGLFYKPMTIVNDDSRVITKLETSLTDDTRVVIYDCHMFIVHTTVEPLATCQVQLLLLNIWVSRCPMRLYHPLDGVTNLKYKLLYFLTPNKKNFKEEGTNFSPG